MSDQTDWLAYLEATPHTEPYQSIAKAWRADKAALTACQLQRDRLDKRCNVLGYLMYGHYLVQRTRENVQADIEDCESALTALRRELSSLSQDNNHD